MTNSTGFGSEDPELVDLAAVYALDAITDAERRDIDARVAASDRAVADAFAREVRAVRETMAQVSQATAVQPSAAVRDRLLEAIAASGGAADAPVSLAARRNRRRNFLLAAAAAVVIAVGGVGVATQLREEPAAPTSAQVLAADDVRTTSGSIEGGGTATVVYSKEVDAGVLVMNNVTPPSAGTVYQMWLIGPSGATAAGTMTPTDVAPSTTAVLEGISDATAVGFSVEPTPGSSQPTAMFAELPLA